MLTHHARLIKDQLKATGLRGIRLVQYGSVVIWRDGVNGNIAAVFAEGVPGLLRLTWNRFTATPQNGSVPDSTQMSLFLVGEEMDKVAQWIPTAFNEKGSLKYPLPLGIQVYQRTTEDYDRDIAPEARLEVRTRKYQHTLGAGFRAKSRNNLSAMQAWLEGAWRDSVGSASSPHSAACSLFHVAEGRTRPLPGFIFLLCSPGNGA